MTGFNCVAIIKNPYDRAWTHINGGAETWPCPYKGKILVNGEYYCKRHDPRKKLPPLSKERNNVVESLLALEEIVKDNNDLLIVEALGKIEKERKLNKEIEDFKENNNKP